MTLAELKWWALHRRWGRRRREQLAAHLGRVQVYFADEDLCDWWAEAIRRARRRGRPIEPSDGWIAATALALDVPLVTHNAADYAGVDGLTLLSKAGA
jgi:predicted nucleic acid-binding protein